MTNAHTSFGMGLTPTVFSVRQHICYRALYAIAHPSVHQRVDQSKMVDGGVVDDGNFR